MMTYNEYKDAVYSLLRRIGIEESKRKIADNPDWFSEEVQARIEDRFQMYDEFAMLESAIVDVFEELVNGCWD